MSESNSSLSQLRSTMQVSGDKSVTHTHTHYYNTSKNNQCMCDLEGYQKLYQMLSIFMGEGGIPSNPTTLCLLQL